MHCARAVQELAYGSITTIERKDNGCFHTKGNHRSSLMQHGSNKVVAELLNQQTTESKPIRVLTLDIMRHAGACRLFSNFPLLVG